MQLYSIPFPRLHVGAIALGTFDGVHIGHAAVIRRAVAEAHAKDEPACVWCFSTPPRAVRPILKPNEKARLIASLGADALIMPELTAEILAMEPHDFLDTLISHLSPVDIVVGFNYTYGHRAAGNVGTLREYLDKKGIHLTVIPPVESDGVPVSSSEIRRRLADGISAVKLLGRDD